MSLIDQYVALIQEKTNAHYAERLPNLTPPTFEQQPGSKYVKIVEVRSDRHGGQCVHSFVNKSTLEVYKAASWRAPAKGARYDLNTDMEKLRQVVDPYTGYLYR